MKPINLIKKVSHSKTVILDLDETLVHCVYNQPNPDTKVKIMVSGSAV
jgi:predicted HAD superfamily phosphohydrolase YqeG